MAPRTRSLLLLHGVVVIFGFTGILGKLISIEAEPLVFWRVTLGGLTTALYLLLRKKWVAWDVFSALKAGGIGWIVAAHWVTFFASIKASSVGLALTMLATAPLFVGLIEPLVYKRKLAWRELAVATVVFLGIALVFQAEQDQTLGILLGLASSLLAAVFSTLNGVMVRQHDPINLSAVELLSASLGMGVWLTVQKQFDATLFALSSVDWLWIGLLAVVATGPAAARGGPFPMPVTDSSCSLRGHGTRIHPHQAAGVAVEPTRRLSQPWGPEVEDHRHVLSLDLWLDLCLDLGLDLGGLAGLSHCRAGHG